MVTCKTKKLRSLIVPENLSSTASVFADFLTYWQHLILRGWISDELVYADARVHMVREEQVKEASKPHLLRVTNLGLPSLI